MESRADLIPLASEYAAMAPAERGIALRSIATWWIASVLTAQSLREVVALAEEAARVLERHGYEMRLIDADSESFVAHAIRFTSDDAVTATSTWDDVEGPSAGVLIQQGTVQLRLAGGSRGLVTQGL